MPEFRRFSDPKDFKDPKDPKDFKDLRFISKEFSMKAYVIVIGDEILLGRVTDTNSGDIARSLNPLGIPVVEVEVVGDVAADIAAAVHRAMAAADIVITTGGLGPTKDDITKAALMEIFGGSLRHDPEVAANIHRIFAAKGRKLNTLTENQALVPDTCTVIQNIYGTAPIMMWERDGHVLVAMPGVPTETRGMLRHAVVPMLSERFHGDKTLTHNTLVVTGITESALAERLDTWEKALPTGFHLAYLPDVPVIRLRLDGIGSDAEATHATAAALTANLCERLGSLVVGEGAMSTAEMLIDKVRSRGYTLGTAESCTGGRIASAITAVAGCSDIFAGGIVAYSNEVKHNILGVSRPVLDSEGAVSRPVVEAMAEGAARCLECGCAVATSGIAGPGGATPDKPVGTVWIAARTPSAHAASLYHFSGDRATVAASAANAAMLMLLQLLNAEK